MAKHRFDFVPDLGQVLISGPLYQWLTQQNSNRVTLCWAPIKQQSDSSLGTQPLRHLNWKMVLFYDDDKRARFGWHLESGGDLSERDVVRYMEEAFGD